ncbi:hypothetical protein OsJ_35441 [Oryza sativa Japonica Group]|uniref:Uncharacterized protein n=1 Tax=Oryza sativa subsp. japonica TaxID=39947 RepID=A3CFJ3_ORYSJ|nr:hypothetical protein OsJ_35441 [Oryza sativa Japonica Group]
MGQQRQAAADQAGRAAGGACVWAVAAALFLAVLAGGGCLVFYLALPPAEVPEWLPVAGLSLVALPWAFWIATCAYRLCCCCFSSSSAPEKANAAAAAPGHVERQPSSAAVAPLPSSTNLKSAVRSAMGSYSHSGTRRVHFGDSTVLGEKAAGAGGGEPAVVEEVEEEEEKECSSATSSHESEAPIAQSMHSS